MASAAAAHHERRKATIETIVDSGLLDESVDRDLLCAPRCSVAPFNSRHSISCPCDRREATPCPSSLSPPSSRRAGPGSPSAKSVSCWVLGAHTSFFWRNPSWAGSSEWHATLLSSSTRFPSASHHPPTLDRLATERVCMAAHGFSQLETPTVTGWSVLQRVTHGWRA